MGQIVKLRRSSVSGQKPTNSHLQLGEIALNTTDGKAFLAVSGSLGESVQEFITTNTSNTGSINLSGSINLIGNQIITGSLTATGGLIGDLDFDYITNTPMLVSGSSQIEITGTTGFSDYSSSVANMTSSHSVSSSYTMTASFALNAASGGIPTIENNYHGRVLAVSSSDAIWKTGIVSSSEQIEITGTTGFSTFTGSLSSDFIKNQNSTPQSGSIYIDGTVKTSNRNGYYIGNKLMMSDYTREGGVNNIWLGGARNSVLTGSGDYDGNYLIAIGSGSLLNNTTGYMNLGIGDNTLKSNTTGYVNIAMGDSTLQNNTTGGFNLSIGANALKNNKIGHLNVSIGHNSLSAATSSINNTVIGNDTLGSGGTTKDNTIIGYSSFRYMGIANRNVAIGSYAGTLISTGEFNTAASESVFIGYNSKPLGNTQTNQIVIGNSAIGHGSNTATIGNSSTIATYLFGTLNVSGSITGMVSGSSQISYTGLSNIPSGIISGSSQLPTGIVSGAEQLPSGIISGAAQLPAGTVSGSGQIDITQTTGYSTFSSSISSSIGGLSSSIASTDSTQNGRLSSIESKTGSISDLNTYTGSNNTVIGTLQTATSSLNSFTSSIQGAIEVTGSNLTVKGDFLVKGTTTIIDSTTLDIKDNIIQLNGTGATNGGLVVRDATMPNTVSGSLLWDTTNDKWIAGQVGFEQPIVLSTTFNSYGDSRYLQVTGGTLSGGLSGTTANFSSDVSIGYTTAQSDKLAVDGSGYFNGNISASGRLLLGNTTDGVAIYLNGAFGDILGINTSLSEYNDLRLRASNTDQMFLRTNGNVDIGYSAAQGYKFAVNGTTYFNGESIINGALTLGGAVTSKSADSHFRTGHYYAVSDPSISVGNIGSPTTGNNDLYIIATNKLRLFSNGIGLLYDSGALSGATTITASSTISALGGNSTQWNTAYSYSQIGHLPLSGGTLSGVLNLNSGVDISWNGGYGFGMPVIVGNSGGIHMYPLGNTDSGNVYINGQTVIHSGNIGSQSVNYAASASNISNSGTVTLGSATEANSITITQPTYTSNKPVKLLNFNWYSDTWSLGNIRSDGASSMGLGVYLSSVEKYRFTDSALFVGLHTVWHTGNLTSTLSNGYLPYWNGSSLGNSIISQSGNVISVAGEVKSTLGAHFGTIENSNTLSVILGGYGISDGSVRYGGYGQLLFNASNAWTAGARKWLITNAYQATKFAIIRGVDSLTNPSLGINGEVGSGTVDFSISNIGNIGIGYTDRTEKLAVAGEGFFSSGVKTWGGFKIYDSTTPLGGLYPYKTVLGSGADNSIGLFSEGEVFFASGGNATKRGVLFGNGNFGLGYTTDQGYKLAVAGSGYFNGALKIESGTLSSKTSANSPVTLYTLSTSSGTTIIMDYTIINAGGTAQRSGTLVCNFNSSSITYNETSTSDLGTSTSAVKMVPVISGGNVLVQSTITGTDTWTIKTSIRYF